MYGGVGGCGGGGSCGGGGGGGGVGNASSANVITDIHCVRDVDDVDTSATASVVVVVSKDRNTLTLLRRRDVGDSDKGGVKSNGFFFQKKKRKEAKKNRRSREGVNGGGSGSGGGVVGAGGAFAWETMEVWTRADSNTTGRWVDDDGRYQSVTEGTNHFAVTALSGQRWRGFAAARVVAGVVDEDATFTVRGIISIVSTRVCHRRITGAVFENQPSGGDAGVLKTAASTSTSTLRAEGRISADGRCIAWTAPQDANANAHANAKANNNNSHRDDINNSRDNLNSRSGGGGVVSGDESSVAWRRADTDLTGVWLDNDNLCSG
jgi:hypothetical protein